MAEVTNKKGTTTQGEITKTFDAEDYAGGSFVLFCPFTKTGRTAAKGDVYFIPNDKAKAKAANGAFGNFVKTHNCLLEFTDEDSKPTTRECYLYSTSHDKKSASEFVSEMKKWILRHDEYVRLYKNGQVCYDPKDARVAVAAGYSEFKKNDFCVGGYWSRPGA